MERMFCAVESDAITGLNMRTTCPDLYLDEDLRLSTNEAFDPALLGTEWLELHGEYKKEFRMTPNYDALQQDVKNAIWMQAIAQAREKLLGVDGDPALPDEKLCKRACALYEQMYRKTASEPCGQCTACREAREWPNVRRGAYRFVWNVAGDLLLHVKALRAHQRRESAKIREQRVASYIPDPRREAYLRKSRRRRAVHPPTDQDDDLGLADEEQADL